MTAVTELSPPEVVASAEGSAMVPCSCSALTLSCGAVVPSRLQAVFLQPQDDTRLEEMCPGRKKDM